MQHLKMTNEVDHINDDKSDYRVENLQWVTNGFNSKKAQHLQDNF